jgi:hypothetical protein
MTLDSAKVSLDRFVQGLAKTIGFGRVDCLVYSRRVNEAAALLSFPCRLDPRGPACFACNVGLRFQSLEPYLQGGEMPVVPTIMTPLHLLRENTSFAEWQFYTDDDLERLREIIGCDLSEIALPFFDKYSKLPEIRRRLQSSSPKDWFILGAEQRLNVLAVIQFFEGDKSGALATLDSALLERRAAMPSKRLPLEAVRRRLAKAL